MKILHVASEVAPWSQSGGLGQVLGALPAAEAALGHAEIAIISPLYRSVKERAHADGVNLKYGGIDVHVNLCGVTWIGRFVTTQRDNVSLHFLDCPALFDRPDLYGDQATGDYPDNAVRFAMLCRGALDGCERLLGGAPTVIHAHDWQTGLVPVYLKKLRPDLSTVTVFTIHNLAFSGLFPKFLVPGLGLAWGSFHLDGLEFWDQLSFLKGGIAWADAVTTVSPSYANEIVTPIHGAGFDGFLRVHGGAIGILNGIDTREWDPARDPRIEAAFTANDPRGKRLCRRALLAELAFDVGDDQLLCGVVSRFTEQKGLEFIADVVPKLRTLGAALVILGHGDATIESRIRSLAAEFPDVIAAKIGFNDDLAHRIYAGVDAMLMPSRFEPSGLTQLYAMRYGSLPIVNPVGGLKDTIHDPGDRALGQGLGNGFFLDELSAKGLARGILRAATLHRDSTAWNRLVAVAMAEDFSWQKPAKSYLDLYERMVTDP